MSKALCMPMAASNRHMRKSKSGFKEYVKIVHEKQMAPVKEEHLRRRDEVAKDFVGEHVNNELDTLPDDVADAWRDWMFHSASDKDKARVVQYAYQCHAPIQTLEEVMTDMGVVLKTEAEIRAELDKEAAENQPVSAADARTYFDNMKAEQGLL